MPVLDMRRPDKQNETIGAGTDDSGNFRLDMGFGRDDCITMFFDNARSARVYFMNVLRAVTFCHVNESRQH